MREPFFLAIHLLVTLARLARRGGVRAVVAESLLLKLQLLVSNRSRKRAPNLTAIDRVMLGLTTVFVAPRRLTKLGALIKPATLLKFHPALINRRTMPPRTSLSRRLPWPGRKPRRTKAAPRWPNGAARPSLSAPHRA